MKRQIYQNIDPSVSAVEAYGTSGLSHWAFCVDVREQFALPVLWRINVHTSDFIRSLSKTLILISSIPIERRLYEFEVES